MANASCSVCNGVHDTRSMRACHQCMGYLCARCGGEHGGYCPDCDEPDE